MKTRQGFISNSSSTAFILDIRKKEAKEILTKMEHVGGPTGLCRNTCIAVGEEIVSYIDEFDEDAYFGKWLSDWVTALGEENIVFVRDSDEEMGGVLFAGYKAQENYDRLREIAEAEMEYH